MDPMSNATISTVLLLTRLLNNRPCITGGTCVCVCGLIDWLFLHNSDRIIYPEHDLKGEILKPRFWYCYRIKINLNYGKLLVCIHWQVIKMLSPRLSAFEKKINGVMVPHIWVDLFLETKGLNKDRIKSRCVSGDTCIDIVVIVVAERFWVDFVQLIGLFFRWLNVPLLTKWSYLPLRKSTMTWSALQRGASTRAGENRGGESPRPRNPAR